MAGERAGQGSVSGRLGGARSLLLIFVAAAVGGSIAGWIGGSIVSGGRATPPAVERAETVELNPYAGFRVSSFRLLDQDGLSVDESLFDDRVTVLTFFFTSCRGPCPDMTRAMREIQDRTAGTCLRLASISVDGSRDTPVVIRAFAEAYGADPRRWRFLTGSPSLVHGLVSESIGFELREQEDVQVEAPDGSAMANILHPTRLLLVGPDRRLIGVYWYNDPRQIDRLIADAARAGG